MNTLSQLATAKRLLQDCHTQEVEDLQKRLDRLILSEIRKLIETAEDAE